MRVEKRLTLIDNKRVLVRSWRLESPGKPRALLLIVHGLGEHSGRYEKFARDLLIKNGIDVYSFDLPGHGESQGLRGYVSKLEDFFKIIHELSKTFKFTKKKVIFGHSLGGLIATRYVQEYPEEFNGLILSSPALAFNIDESIKNILSILKFLNLLLPWITTKNRINPDLLSRNKEAVRKYIEDPLVHDRISIRLFCEMVKNSEYAKRKIENIKIPILLFGGTEDKIVPFNGVKLLFSKASNSQITEFEGGYHELFEDPEHYGPLLETLSKWFKEKIILNGEKIYE